MVFERLADELLLFCQNPDPHKDQIKNRPAIIFKQVLYIQHPFILTCKFESQAILAMQQNIKVMVNIIANFFEANYFPLPILLFRPQFIQTKLTNTRSTFPIGSLVGKAEGIRILQKYRSIWNCRWLQLMIFVTRILRSKTNKAIFSLQTIF